MARKRDPIDLKLEAWARIHRELIGLASPVLASQYVGALHCTLGKRRDLHHGSRTNLIPQHWPELPFRGELYVVNIAIKQMDETLREIVEWNWTIEQPRDRRLRADLMGISWDVYWKRVARVRERIAAALAIAEFFEMSRHSAA